MFLKKTLNSGIKTLIAIHTLRSRDTDTNVNKWPPKLEKSSVNKNRSHMQKNR